MRSVQSWGRLSQEKQRSASVVDRHTPLPMVAGTILPFGNGRSYGDSCLNPQGTVVCVRPLDRFVAFDDQTGLLECEPGLLLSEIIEVALPRGWFLSVTPGTAFATVGGAIANDVHGKNHPTAGSFGHYVAELDLRRSDGSVLTCSPTAHADWLRATIGGLGLTGLITRVVMQLKRIPGPVLEVSARRFGGLAEFFKLSLACQESEYSVAWVDASATGKSTGRGVFTIADHHAGGHALVADAKTKARIRFVPHAPLINPLTTSAFNKVYFSLSPRTPTKRLSPYAPFFYPLDALENWNLLYGKRGFFQYQCVIPPAIAEEAIREILDRIARSGEGSFLTVLKNLGPKGGAGMLSFPREGTTLAVDFPNRGDRTLRLLDSLDSVTLQAGGAVYPAKDARMSAGMFASSFPELTNFRSYVDPAFSSGLWRRVFQ